MSRVYISRRALPAQVLPLVKKRGRPAESDEFKGEFPKVRMRLSPDEALGRRKTWPAADPDLA